MLKFFKTHSYEIMRFFIMQVGIAIFAFVLTTAMDTIHKSAVLWVSILSILFYLFLVYSVAWEVGAKDKLRIDAGRQERTSFKGALMMLYAQIPNYILGILMVVGGACFALGAAAVGARIFSIGYLIALLLESMYVGVIGAIIVGKEAYLAVGIAFLVSTLLGLITAGIGYYLGSIGKGVISMKSARKR